jgi:hypothetical protein
VQAAIISSGTLDQAFGGEAANPLELNFEGSQDDAVFMGRMSYLYTASTYFTFFNAYRTGSNFSVIGTGNQIKELSTSDYIGSATNTPGQSGGFFYFRSTPGTRTTGNWTDDGDTGFIGFSFKLEEDSTTEGGAKAGDPVYGWAEVERLTGGEGKLLGWAYEDTGQKIKVGNTGRIPEPSAFALLALGAAGLHSLRQTTRRRSRPVAS